MSLPGFALVTSFIFSQGEKRGVVFIICLYLALPLSVIVKRGVVSTYVPTWLCLCHSIHLMAR